MMWCDADTQGWPDGLVRPHTQAQPSAGYRPGALKASGIWFPGSIFSSLPPLALTLVIQRSSQRWDVGEGQH